MLAVRFHLRRRDPIGLILGLWHLWRFRRKMRSWDQDRMERLKTTGDRAE